MQDEERVLQYTLEDGGNVVNASHVEPASEDCFALDTWATIGEDAAYFSFTNRTNNDNVVDTSMIKGGYGLYRIPINKKMQSEVNNMDDRYIINYYEWDNMETVIPLDDGASAVGQVISGGDLLFFINEEMTNYMIVYDMKNKEIRNKIRLGESNIIPREIAVTKDDDANLILINIDYDKVCLISKSDDSYSVELYADSDNEYVNNYECHKMTYENGRLMVVSGCPDECKLYVSVYDDNGLCYCGEYTSSLNKCNVERQQDDLYYDDYYEGWTKPVIPAFENR